ncbi:MAG: S8 family serine peptidase [Hyphomicrobiaceae bacterium]
MVSRLGSLAPSGRYGGGSAMTVACLVAYVLLLAGAAPAFATVLRPVISADSGEKAGRPETVQFRIRIGGGGINLGGGGRFGRVGRGGGRIGRAPRLRAPRIRPSATVRVPRRAAQGTSTTVSRRRQRVRIVHPRRRGGGQVTVSVGGGTNVPGVGHRPRRPGGYPPRRPRRPIIVVAPPVTVPPAIVSTSRPPRWRPGTRIGRRTPRIAPPLAIVPPVVLPPVVARPPAAPPPAVAALAPDDIWPNEVVVFVDTTASSPGSDLAVAQTHNLARVSFEDIPLAGQRLVLYRIPDGRSVSDVVQALTGDQRVALVAPNFRYATAGDARSGAVVGARVEPASAGAAAAASPLQYALAKLRVPEARAVATGRNVTVAVIDTAIDGAHPALAGAVGTSADFTDGRGTSADAHGTAIAGIIGARGDLQGVAPGARIAAARAFFRASGAGKAESSSYMITRAIYWALGHEARVLNMSFAGPKDPSVAKAVGDALGRGAVVVAAAGNNGAKAPPAYPAAYPGVIAVTAIDTADKLYDAANRGTYVSLAAPGVNVLVAAPKASYGFDEGTSIAAAHVSGVIALMIERQPTLNTDDVRRILAESAIDLGEPGRDMQFGAGRVDAMAAIGAIRSALAIKSP